MAATDLELLICDADNMANVLYTLLEGHFAMVPDGNFVLTEGEAGCCS